MIYEWRSTVEPLPSTLEPLRSYLRSEVTGVNMSYDYEVSSSNYVLRIGGNLLTRVQLDDINTYLTRNDFYMNPQSEGAAGATQAPSPSPYGANVTLRTDRPTEVSTDPQEPSFFGSTSNIFYGSAKAQKVKKQYTEDNWV